MEVQRRFGRTSCRAEHGTPKILAQCTGDVHTFSIPIPPYDLDHSQLWGSLQPQSFETAPQFAHSFSRKSKRDELKLGVRAGRGGDLTRSLFPEIAGTRWGRAEGEGRTGVTGIRNQITRQQRPTPMLTHLTTSGRV